MSKKQRLFVDMDGTLAVFKPVDQLETLYEKGYFEKLQPISTVLEAVKNIIRERPEIEVYILSAYLSDSPYALQEKNQWLDRYLPELPMDKRVFLPCGADKKEYIPGGIRSSDVLLDDYTQNLQLWQPPARGIKLLNGINHTRGTWQHDRISYEKTAAQLAEDIVDAMQGIPIKDWNPAEKDASAFDKLDRALQRQADENMPETQRMSLAELTAAAKEQPKTKEPSGNTQEKVDDEPQR